MGDKSKGKNTDKTKKKVKAAKVGQRPHEKRANQATLNSAGL